jgi:GNAT superfamily N-acetyltransferase
MNRDDIPAGMRLTETAGWNQERADWEMVLETAGKQTSLVTVHNGRVIGTTAALTYGDRCAWIGLVLVDPEFRRIGVATRMLREITGRVEFCEHIRLDATPAGRPVYEKEGFVPDWGLERLVCPSLPSVEAPSRDVEVAEESDLDAIVGLDREVFGHDRSAVLRRLWQRSRATAWKIDGEGGLRGFCLGRPGARYHQIGPVVAASQGEAIQLIRGALQDLQCRPVVLDVPDRHRDLKRWLANRGFAADRSLTRMTWGDASGEEEVDRYFAVAGPELG